MRLAVLAGDRDAHARVVLLDALGGPAETALDIRERRHLAPQHLLHLVLRQPVVLLEVVGAHELAPGRRVPVLAHQRFVGGDLADRIAGRHDARGAQLVDDAPEVEMLERALGEVLTLGEFCSLRRRSTSAQEMPRSPSSTASATPTGPPPTMMTWCWLSMG